MMIEVTDSSPRSRKALRSSFISQHFREMAIAQRSESDSHSKLRPTAPERNERSIYFALARSTVRSSRQSMPRRRIEMPGFFGRVIPLIVVALAFYGYSEYSRRVAPNNAVSAAQSRDQTASSFRCDGRTHCSQMTSCAEATFFLRNCLNVQMDGNHDGIPCEQQWCTRPFAK